MGGRSTDEVKWASQSQLVNGCWRVRSGRLPSTLAAVVPINAMPARRTQIDGEVPA